MQFLNNFLGDQKTPRVYTIGMCEFLSARPMCWKGHSYEALKETVLTYKEDFSVLIANGDIKDITVSFDKIVMEQVIFDDKNKNAIIPFNGGLVIYHKLEGNSSWGLILSFA